MITFVVIKKYVYNEQLQYFNTNMMLDDCALFYRKKLQWWNKCSTKLYIKICALFCMYLSRKNFF